MGRAVSIDRIGVKLTPFSSCIMTNSDFLTRQFEIFRGEFPASDGWQIFKTESNYFMLLRELAAAEPGLVKKAEISTMVRHEVSYPEEKDAPELEIVEKHWSGDCRLNLNGEEINVRSLLYQLQAPTPFFLVAAKNFAAVESLYLRILEFDLERTKTSRLKKMRSCDTAEINLPEMSWDDVILPPEMERDIRTSVETFFRAREAYKQFNLPYKRGFIFSGPAGCGKTLTAKTIAATANTPPFLVIPGQNAEKTLASIHSVFSNAATNAPSIVLIEELDRFSDAHQPLAQVLNLLDGLNTLKGVLVIGTSNHPEKIDPALLLRPSRFDRICNFPLPDYDCRLRFLRRKAGDSFPATLLEDAAKQCAGFSMSYVQEIFASAITIALCENRRVESPDILKSIDLLKKQIRAAQQSMKEVGDLGKNMGFGSVEGQAR